MTHLPDHIQRQIKCRFCGNSLSACPVWVLPDGSSACGRCPVRGVPVVRHVAYESLAAGFTFPCRHRVRGCQEWIPWNGAPEHERRCLYSSYFRLLFSHPLIVVKSSKSRRDPHEERLLVVPDQALQHLTCVTCGGFLSSPPVVVLNDGASQCYRCLEQAPTQYLRHFAFETFLSIMIFPCIYKIRGCPKRFVFGVDIQYHENNCEYAPPPKQLNSPGRRFVTDDGKTKGVIKTNTGHIFATITPNSLPPGELLSLVTNNHIGAQQRKVSEDTDRQSSQISNGDDSSSGEYPKPRHDLGLIDELKIKQKLRKSKGNRKEKNQNDTQDISDNEPYDESKSYSGLKEIYYEYKDVIDEYKGQDHPNNHSKYYNRNLSSSNSDEMRAQGI